MNFTEDKNLIKESIILNIDNHSFEFIVTCTIYGEILSVQNLFFELPEDAQRMMFGSKYESIKKKVFTHEQLLPYRVLLGYATKLSHPEQHIDRDFDDFIERIY